MQFSQTVCIGAEDGDEVENKNAQRYKMYILFKKRLQKCGLVASFVQDVAGPGGCVRCIPRGVVGRSWLAEGLGTNLRGWRFCPPPLPAREVGIQRGWIRNLVELKRGRMVGAVGDVLEARRGTWFFPPRR